MTVFKSMKDLARFVRSSDSLFPSGTPEIVKASLVAQSLGRNFSISDGQSIIREFNEANAELERELTQERDRVEAIHTKKLEELADRIAEIASNHLVWTDQTGAKTDFCGVYKWQKKFLPAIVIGADQKRLNLEYQKCPAKDKKYDLREILKRSMMNMADEVLENRIDLSSISVATRFLNSELVLRCGQEVDKIGYSCEYKEKASECDIQVLRCIRK